MSMKKNLRKESQYKKDPEIPAHFLFSVRAVYPLGQSIKSE